MKKLVLAGLIALIAGTASATPKFTEDECRDLLAASLSSAFTIIGIPVSLSLFATSLVGCRHHGMKWR